MGSKDTRFKNGNKAGKGRPKGSKNKITKAWLNALSKDFVENQVEVLDKLRKDELPVYARLVAQLVPRDLDVNLTGNINISVIDYAEGDE